MPLPRFQKLPIERQRAILDHAADEFAAHGPARASINRILKAAGVSKGAFYYYFHDKDDLWLAVMHRELVPFLPAESALPSPEGSWWDAMEALTLGALAELLQAPRSMALLREVWRHPDPAVVDRLMAPLHAWWSQLLRGGQARGEVRTDLPESMLVDLTLAMGTALDRWFAERWDDMPADEAMALSMQSLTLFKDMLMPRARATD